MAGASKRIDALMSVGLHADNWFVRMQGIDIRHDTSQVGNRRASLATSNRRVAAVRLLAGSTDDIDGTRWSPARRAKIGDRKGLIDGTPGGRPARGTAR
jgi:hypothetical protein